MGVFIIVSTVLLFKFIRRWIIITNKIITLIISRRFPNHCIMITFGRVKRIKINPCFWRAYFQRRVKSSSTAEMQIMNSLNPGSWPKRIAWHLLQQCQAFFNTSLGFYLCLGADLGYLKGGWLRKVFEISVANKLLHIYIITTMYVHWIYVVIYLYSCCTSIHTN